MCLETLLLFCGLLGLLLGMLGRPAGSRLPGSVRLSVRLGLSGVTCAVGLLLMMVIVGLSS